MAVVIVEGIEGDDEYAFAHELFNHWGIGRQGYNDGLLFLYVKDIRAMKFETGYALEGVLPDAYLDKLLNEQIFPRMRRGRVDEAFTIAVDMIAARLNAEEARQELLLNAGSPRVVGGNILSAYLILAFVCLIVMSVVFYGSSKHLRGENNLRYAMLAPTVRYIGVAACVFPVPMLLLWLYARRQLINQRKRRMLCNHCGGTMRLLDEAEEDMYLDHKQQAEERVNTVDYDVWKCNVCDNFKILPYDKMSAKYSVCPHCGAKTYVLNSDHIILPPTTLTPGRGEKLYLCANCGASDVASYVIPIVFVPRSSGRGGFGSGGFGGGFGGGMSGGGGAGGRF